jgi:four helix bundle protein
VQGVQEFKELQNRINSASYKTLIDNVFIMWYNSPMNKPAKTFRDLIVWQKAHEFVLKTYTLTKQFPRDEQYCLIPQFRRAAVSIPANIAEGFRKRSVSDKNRFFNISQGSLEECRYYLTLGQDLGYGDCLAIEPLLEEVSRLLVAYAQAITKNASRRSKPFPGK